MHMSNVKFVNVLSSIDYLKHPCLVVLCNRSEFQMYICFAVKLINGVYVFHILFGILVSCFFKQLQFIGKQDLLSINKL